MQYYEKALECFSESLEISNRIGYKQGVGWTSMQLADAYIPLGRFEEAEAILNAAMVTFEQLTERNGIANTTYRIGNLYKARGELDKAMEIYMDARQRAKQLGSPIWEGMILEDLCEIYKVRNKKQLYVASLSEAIEIYRLVKSRRATILEQWLQELESTDRDSPS